MTDQGSWQSKRQRAAIGRTTLSMPLQQCLMNGVVGATTSVLDYGCGRGQDVNRLLRMGIKASGWDPYFAPGATKTTHDVVTLTYVLNVIEDPRERQRALEEAWSLATTALCVSCRPSWERSTVDGTEFADGVMTGRETFQRFFTTAELRQMVEDVTGARCVSPAPGVVIVFRRASDLLSYVARTTIGQHDWRRSDDSESIVREVVTFAESRGRLPGLDEVPADIAGHMARIPRSSFARIIKESADPTALESGRKRATLETLLYLGTSLFNGRASFTDLPPMVQGDIRACFASYKEACVRADRLLAKIGDDTYIRGAMRNSPGKLTASALYVHERAVGKMPVVLRLYEHCGYVATGRPEGWNILKLDHRGRRVTWSAYPTFDSDPHPRLMWTYGVDMATRRDSYSDFGKRTNRPLLHRKEEFLHQEDPLVPKYRRLTTSEVRAGLYENPTIIGLEDGWNAELDRCRVELRGHRLVKIKH